MQHYKLNFATRSVPTLALLFSCFFASAYTVTDLTASYQNGQVFLTWKNASASNLQYNVYRSTSKFTSSSQLTSSNFMGFVRDNSAKNAFWSQQTNQDIYYSIIDGGQPLASNKGVYAVTCTNNAAYYYAVTVTDLSNGNESKSINLGENSLSTGVNETVAKPQPVYQYSIQTQNNETKDIYVQFVNNQETALYPAMNSTGSYGFTFYLVKRGSTSGLPLFVLYEGEGAAPDEAIPLDESFSDCYAIGMFDWLPIQEGNSVGDNTYFCCYHEHFDIYTNSQAVPTNGIVKTYPQKRVMEAIKWAETKFGTDTNKIYLRGVSANGFGALLTATIYSEKIAAVYAQVEPIGVSPIEDVYQEMWGQGSSGLVTDVLQWDTQLPLTFNKLTNLNSMLEINELRSLPVIYDVHGKNDTKVSWSSNKVNWMDALDADHYGGTWYWDQRDHGGNGKNFESDETEPNYYRFALNKSYPAFSNCSINQDPGNGNKSNGDKYGAINGYLDWDDDITDQDCKYVANVFIKDFYVGGVLDPEQYNTCTTDITFRRMQNFQPSIGSTINWKNKDADNIIIQSGSFTYNGGLITLPNLTVNKTGNTIKLKIVGCQQKMSADEEDDASNIYFSKSGNGYVAHVSVLSDENAELVVYDVAGRILSERKLSLTDGENQIDIPSPGTGIFLVQVKGETFSETGKLFF